jgi:hypothetical protein
MGTLFNFARLALFLFPFPLPENDSNRGFIQSGLFPNLIRQEALI